MKNLPSFYETAAPAISGKTIKENVKIKYQNAKLRKIFYYMPNLCALCVEKIPDGFFAGNSVIFSKVRGL